MTTDSPDIVQDLAISAYDLFMWPGTWVLSELPAYAPGLALQLGIGIGDTGIVPTAVTSAVLWTIAGFVAWKLVKTLCTHTWYVGLRLKTFLVSRLQVRQRQQLLAEPVIIPDVELDELDLAVLDLGSTLPPGLALTAAELSGELTRRPDQVQQSLDKLRSYGLVDDAIGQTDGFDNYCLTRSGAALLSMWQRRGGIVVSQPT